MQKAKPQRSFKKPAQNSLVAFMRAIKFRHAGSEGAGNAVERYFAKPQQTARQRKRLAEEAFLVRSAN
jgi:hypothetical protein